MSKQYNVAIVGATGMVGRKMLEMTEFLGLPVKNLYLFASARSAGNTFEYRGNEIPVYQLTHNSFKDYNIDIALFSAGGAVSGEYAPLAAESGAVVIDNSSRWRMDTNVPLLVPVVNPEAVLGYSTANIIANPNCSTIQAVTALAPLHKKYGVERVIYSTYQAVSGAGMGGVSDLEDTMAGKAPKKFPHTIAFNILPQIDDFLDTGYTKEEQKMIDETRKILGVPDMRVTATTVRVPVYNGHSESLNVELKTPFDIAELRNTLATSPGIVVQDDPHNLVYPMPVDVTGKDDVYIGRIRRDFSAENSINMFVVADNIRRGAATNAVEIAHLLIKFWESGGNK